MTGPVPPPIDNDAEQLRLLGIFHYLLAVFTGLVSLIPVIHLVLGILLVRGFFDDSSGEPPPALVGWIFIGLAGVVICLGLAFAVCLALAGTYLRSSRHRLFCLVIAAIACAFAPLGTVLGVFTIIVLMRDSVRARFEGPAPV